MAKKEAVPAVVEEKALVATPDYGEYAGAGYEDDTTRDEMVPFLNILQALSPEVAEKTVPGAQSGMLINSVTKELYESGLVFQPVHKISSWVEWIPRLLGGGLVAMHTPDSEEVLEALRKCSGRPQGAVPFKREGDTVKTELVETVYVYGHILNDAGSEIVSRVVLPFTSTKLKYWRSWNTTMKTVKGRPPRFAFRTLVTTFLDRNKRGQTFYSPLFSPFGEDWVSCLINPKEHPHLIEAALEFRKGIAGGTIKADFEGGEKAHAAASGEDDELPF